MSNKKPKPIAPLILIVGGTIEFIVSFLLPAPWYEGWHNFLLSMGGTMLIIGLIWFGINLRGSGSRMD